MTMHRLGRLREIAGIALCWLTIGSVLVFLVTKFLLWPLTAWMPISSQFALGHTGYPLLQYSKQDLIPRNYILITGDSYAYGVGEYLYDHIKQRRLSYHAGHTLHTLTKKDVISIGFPHMGSFDDVAILPTTFIEKIHNKYGIALEDPQTILVFFYEGNDLANNAEDARYQYAGVNYTEGSPDNLENFLSHIRKKRMEVLAERDPTSGSLFFDFLAGTIYLSDFLHPPRRIYGPYEPGAINKIHIDGKTIAIPDNLEPLGMFLTEQEFALGIFVFENSLRVLQKRYPHSKIGIVYIPSPLSSYTLSSATVSVFERLMTRHEAVVYPASRVRKTSNQTCTAIQQVALSRGVGFIDARAHFRKLTQHSQLHSSQDWNHLNQAGYVALGEVSHQLFQQLTTGSSPSACANQ